MSEYANLLRSPAWQKRRLEILGARGFKCEECDSTEKELHVHHRHYSKGLKPWEYESSDYLVLCSTCHESRHEIERLLREQLGRLDSESLRRLSLVLRLHGSPYQTRISLASYISKEIEMRHTDGVGDQEIKILFPAEDHDFVDAQLAEIAEAERTESDSIRAMGGRES